MKLGKFRLNSLTGRLSLVLGAFTLVTIIVVLIFNSVVKVQWMKKYARDQVNLVKLVMDFRDHIPDAQEDELRARLTQGNSVAIGPISIDSLIPIDEVSDEFLKHFSREIQQTSFRKEYTLLFEREESFDWLWMVFEQTNSNPDRYFGIGFPLRYDGYQNLIWSLSIAIAVIGLVFIACVFIARGLSRSFSQVSVAAEQFRGLEGFEPLPDSGPIEVRTLARNFNKMAEEITALTTNRTTISAGLAHDLRTPLTRITLALEFLPEETDPKLVSSIQNNLKRMTSFIADATLYAKGESETEREVDLKQLIESTVGVINSNISIEWKGEISSKVFVAVTALDRCITNLVYNAQFHGKGASLSVIVNSEDVEIHVVDQGPGIPKEDRERVLRPFVRLDHSRNLDTGGSGLGLAIVAQLCLIHNWSIRLEENSAGGGLDVVLGIPLKTTINWKENKLQKPSYMDTHYPA